MGSHLPWPSLILSLLLASAGASAVAGTARTGGDTFSIVAVDPATGEVGSAGASCIAGSIIISDMHPGVGAIHTQSYWNSQNQNNAHDLMEQGWSPHFVDSNSSAWNSVSSSYSENWLQNT